MSHSWAAASHSHCTTLLDVFSTPLSESPQTPQHTCVPRVVYARPRSGRASPHRRPWPTQNYLQHRMGRSGVKPRRRDTPVSMVPEPCGPPSARQCMAARWRVVHTAALAVLRHIASHRCDRHHAARASRAHVTVRPRQRPATYGHAAAPNAPVCRVVDAGCVHGTLADSTRPCPVEGGQATALRVTTRTPSGMYHQRDLPAVHVFLFSFCVPACAPQAPRLRMGVVPTRPAHDPLHLHYARGLYGETARNRATPPAVWCDGGKAPSAMGGQQYDPMRALGVVRVRCVVAHLGALGCGHTLGLHTTLLL